jgi:hypothetical protein
LKISYLNGSPKKKASMSANILNAMEKRLAGTESIWLTGSAREAAAELLSCDALVMAFPLYVDGIPSHLLRFLEELERALSRPVSDPATPADDPPKSVKLYSIINCGFMEPENAQIAIDMIDRWRQKSGLVAGQTAAFGGGGMGPSLKIGRGAGKNYGKALDAMTENIKNESTETPILTSANIPRSLYMKVAHFHWRAAARKRGLKPKELYRRP